MTSGTCRQWNVVSGGPSRMHLSTYDLLPDAPVVTVNRAVDIVDLGITVDFACFADPPGHLSKSIALDRYLQPPIQVWCPRTALYRTKGVDALHDMVTLWEPFLPASVGIRTTPFGTVPTEDGKTSRFFFCLLGALERVMMFRPERVRVLCADMMGSWMPNATEEACELHQSDLETARRDLSRFQKQVVETKGKNPAIVTQRDNAQIQVGELQKRGDPGLFKRWAHERFSLKEWEKRAVAAGAAIEWVSPKAIHA